MAYHDTPLENPHNGACPSCLTVICLRCVVLDQRMSPDGFDGCADCDRVMKRLARTYRAHREKDHAEGKP